MALIHRSHHVGAAGRHVAALAERGLVALLLSNTPAAIAPWGGHTPLFGTDPIAFAAPRADAPPLVVDLALSQVARGRIVVAAREGHPLEDGWAVDREGRPTTDAAAALEGAMLPIGGAKGAALALMVELLTAGLAGARFGSEASSFLDGEGDPPGVGHLLLAVDPGPVGRSPSGSRRCVARCWRRTAAGFPVTHVPRLRERARRDGVEVEADLHTTLVALAGR